MMEVRAHDHERLPRDLCADGEGDPCLAVGLAGKHVNPRLLQRCAGEDRLAVAASLIVDLPAKLRVQAGEPCQF